MQETTQPRGQVPREYPATNTHRCLSPTGSDSAETQSADQTFRLSFFNSPYIRYPKLRAYTLGELIALFTRRPIVRPTKNGCAFSPALFSGPRKKENVVELALLVLDYDHEATLERDLEPWQKLGVAFLAYTTYSHLRRTEHNPHAEERFRLVIPMTTPIPGPRFPALWAWAASAAGGHMDGPSGKDRAHLYLLPAIARPEAPFFARAYPGAFLDWRRLNLRWEPEPETGGQVPSLAGRVSPRYAAAALEYELARVRSARVGERNTTLNRSAFALGQLIGAGGLGERQVAGELEEAAVKVGLPRAEARRTIRSGIEAGKRCPRSLPARMASPRTAPASTAAWKLPPRV